MNTSISQPETPQAPSSAEAVKAWVESLPQVYETQLAYAPKEAAQQISLAQQYAAPLGEAYLAAQKAMYPEEYALRDELMSKAKEGMTSDVPDWMKKEYQDSMNAQLGTNVNSGVGADYVSRNLLQMKKDWQDYYTNMALSLSGSQPTFTAQSPSYTNYMSNYTPSSVMGYNSSNYNTYANAYSNMYGTNASKSNYNSSLPFSYMSGFGNLLSGFGSL